jgi:hypothetical protein
VCVYPEPHRWASRRSRWALRQHSRRGIVIEHVARCGFVCSACRYLPLQLPSRAPRAPRKGRRPTRDNRSPAGLPCPLRSGRAPGLTGLSVCLRQPNAAQGVRSRARAWLPRPLCPRAPRAADRAASAALTRRTRLFFPRASHAFPKTRPLSSDERYLEVVLAGSLHGSEPGRHRAVRSTSPAPAATAATRAQRRPRHHREHVQRVRFIRRALNRGISWTTSLSW